MADREVPRRRRSLDDVAGGVDQVVSAQGDCLIHQRFQLSGPVICNTITLPDESSQNPTFFTYPSIGNLTDGQKYCADLGYAPLPANVVQLEMEALKRIKI